MEGERDGWKMFDVFPISDYKSFARNSLDSSISSGNNFLLSSLFQRNSKQICDKLNTRCVTIIRNFPPNSINISLGINNTKKETKEENKRKSISKSIRRSERNDRIE